MKRRECISLIGVMIAWPIAARAQQQPRIFRVAFVISSGSLAELRTRTTRGYGTFLEEMRKRGYVEGRNLIVDLFSGEGREENYAALARDVVELKPDVIFGVATPMVLRLKSATTIIPIVAFTANPVAFGIVSNLARPDGNITGVTLDAGLEIWGKRVELLKEAIPGLTRASFLGKRGTWESAVGRVVRDSARTMGFALQGWLLEGSLRDAEYRRLFASMSQERAQAVIIGDDAENFTYRKLIIDLAEETHLPTVSPWREHVELGGLMGYAFDLPDIYRQAARQVAQILEGAKIAEIPYYQTRKFDLVVNLKTAKTLGITMPPSLLARADEVIE